MKIILQDQNKLILKKGIVSNVLAGVIFGGVGVVLTFQLLPADKTAPLWFGLIFLIVGVLIIIFSRIEKIEAEKISRTLKVERLGLLGKSQEILNFDDMEQLIVRQEYERGKESTRKVKYLDLVLKNGEVLTLTKLSSNVSGIITIFKIFNRDEIGKTLADYIGIPYSFQKPPSLSEVVNQAIDRAGEKNNQM